MNDTAISNEISHAVNSPSAIDVRALVERVSARIAPSWPLDRLIAVNPLWGFRDKALPEVANELSALSGVTLLMPRAYYRAAYAAREFDIQCIEQALSELRMREDAVEVIEWMNHDATDHPVRVRFMDVADSFRDLVHELSFREVIINNTSQFLAAWFDENGAISSFDRSAGLYRAWRSHITEDLNPELLLAVRGLRSAARRLPDDSLETIVLALDELDVLASEFENYLTGLLLDMNGWAAHCAYRGWMSRLAGGLDSSLGELLAIRLAWEWLVMQVVGKPVAQRWQLAMAQWHRVERAASKGPDHGWVLQRALEVGWQKGISKQLRASLSVPVKPRSLQAVFCIDVRSEVIRRALESQSDAIQTLGFAGFFGLPIEYREVGAQSARPQLPGLLAPKFRAAEQVLSLKVAELRREHVSHEVALHSFKSGALSNLSFVDALGAFYAGHLLWDTLGVKVEASKRHEHRGLRLESLDGTPLGVEERADLAAGILRGMGLTKSFANVVMLVGHGSTSSNNPFAAGLDCGACCGQTGEVNARVAATLMNDSDVREHLAHRGLTIPPSTVFIPALHDTTTDVIEIFDDRGSIAQSGPAMEQIRQWLEQAGKQARRERAVKLGLSGASDANLVEAMRRRANDWSEVRPEWGLAGNAGFILAPRHRTRRLNLEGRCFLHDYNSGEDPDATLLAQLMTAPMVVAHWINFQYYASTVDPIHFGSGNKVLHNVVGGHIGVFEGNGGDLRIGLPIQSVHDGSRWVHTPLRLSAFIEAPRASIDDVLHKHDVVRQLVENGWLHLFQIDADTARVHRRSNSGWTDWE